MKAQLQTLRNAKRILWVITDIGKGSGGQRTVFQNVMFLIKEGYKCDLLLNESNCSVEEARNKLLEWYDIDFPGDIICNGKLSRRYDAAIATYYTTAKTVANLKIKHKLYFVQDYEPWFFPMSQERIEAKESYSLGLKTITIGKWLAKEINNKFKTETKYFRFCADLNIYKKKPEIEKENAVCFVYQPVKPWRCAEMGLRALQIVQEVMPDVKIYLYGSEKTVPFNIKAEHLGLLSLDECNELYNKCKVGICMSASNPSRVPFEMMAAGLPVVDLYLEHNIYDFTDDGCLLAEPSPEAIAAAILKILQNEKLRRDLGLGGEKYMSKNSIERGFREFGEIVDEILLGKKMEKGKTIGKKYNKKAVPPLTSKVKIGERVYFKTFADIEREKADEENRKRQLTIAKRVYLKIRYKLKGY